MRFKEISRQTREDLLASSLNPDHVVELILKAFAEDLDGGNDVTSVATIPVDHQSIAEFRTRAVGVTGGRGVVRAVLGVVVVLRKE